MTRTAPASHNSLRERAGVRLGFLYFIGQGLPRAGDRRPGRPYDLSAKSIHEQCIDMLRAIGRSDPSVDGSDPSVDARRARLVAHRPMGLTHRRIGGWRHGRIANTIKYRIKRTILQLSRKECLARGTLIFKTLTELEMCGKK